MALGGGYPWISMKVVHRFFAVIFGSCIYKKVMGSENFPT